MKQHATEKLPRSMPASGQDGDDGDHSGWLSTSPAPGVRNTIWSGNACWIELFPEEIKRKEMAYYKQRQNRFGVPLDNRSAYTKLDWMLWTATMADSDAEFHSLIAPVYDWLNQTPTRVPLTDWYWTTDGKQAGFSAGPRRRHLYQMLNDDPLGRSG